MTARVSASKENHVDGRALLCVTSCDGDAVRGGLLPSA
jgi:hypothetical protein